MAQQDDQDAGVAAALAGIRTGLSQVPPLPPAASKFSPEDLAWVRAQVADAVADGMEEGAKRIVTKYGTYATVALVASLVTAATAVGILIAILVKGD
jgi:hypothetical protein